MKTYTVTLTDTEDTAFRYVAVSPEEWINNAAKSRCNIAVEEIVKICVDQCLNNGVQIPGTRDEIVALAVEKKWILSAEEKNYIDEQHKV